MLKKRLRLWDSVTGKVIGTAIEDHEGSIRSISSLPGIDGYTTTSNDGTVKMRSIEGQPFGTVCHLLQDDGSPPFVLDRYYNIFI